MVEYQALIDNYNEELRVYKSELQAPCRESELDVAGTTAKNNTYITTGTTLWEVSR